jgi:2-polyprenyl-6-methoxyphenol hydroxylase-like FAD-dependent oxidoreductase
MTSEPLPPQVLVAGAGPTGLVLAIWLARRGVRVRIVDKTPEPGTTSRALAVQARTLEFYRQLGFGDEVVERGRQVSAVNIWVKGKPKARAPFGAMGAGVSPYAYALVFPQDEHERLLVEHLKEAGVEVERNTELLGFEQTDGRVRSRILRPNGAVETCESDYIAGCDGAHSTVRKTLGIDFPGGTYSHLFYVADVDARGPAVNGELHVGLESSDFLAVFPLKGEGRVRLVGTLKEDPARPEAPFGWKDAGKHVIASMGIDVARVNWFSTYRVHHRVAGSFHQALAFLLGDAAHIHSPVGGQGMNTGIGDAVNLGWKLASVIKGETGASLLDSYEPERIAFARRLVATTDRAFVGVTSSGFFARRFRMNLVPFMVPVMFRFPSFKRLMFRTVSQTAIEYRESLLSEGKAGTIGGGDRLPWLPPIHNAKDNFSPLTSLSWQVHVYGAASPGLEALCAERGISLHLFPWSKAASNVGLSRDALYLVRPDGYVALADPKAAPSSLSAFLDRQGLKLTPPPVHGAV